MKTVHKTKKCSDCNGDLIYGMSYENDVNELYECVDCGSTFTLWSLEQ